MDRIDSFEKKVSKTTGYIKYPSEFIYDNIEDPSTQELIECTRAIAVKNAESLANKSKDIASLRIIIQESQAIVADPIIIKEQSKTIHTTEESPIRKDLSDIIKFIECSNLDEEAKMSLKTLTHQDILRIRLYFYRKIIELQKKIREIAIVNPGQNITTFQNELNTYEIIVEFIKELEQVEVKEEVKESEISNVIFAPNNKKSSYFYEDILEYQEDRLKAIKAAIDKIIDGYILKTSSTRPIKSINNLFEYKHPNGIRILYFTLGSNIVICSLFYKDKQRSSRIKSEYEEAVSRFKSCEQYITTNISNPDFYIEQAELQGQINAYLEDGIVLSKKVGE